VSKFVLYCKESLVRSNNHKFYLSHINSLGAPNKIHYSAKQKGSTPTFFGAEGKQKGKS